MAIDAWLLEQHRLGLHPPVLRFYTWSPAAISLGYHQQRWPECWHDLTWQGRPIDLVRRPTGGRAVLHQGDLTYAIITSGLVGSRVQVYQLLCEFLIAGWRSLGLELHYGSIGRVSSTNPNCFSIATGADLVLENGSKLIGSAQLYRGGAILQHGSMRLAPNRALFAEVFGEGEVVKGAAQHQPVLIPSIVDALMNAAERCFNIQLAIQPLSETEWQTILAQPPLEVGFPHRRLRVSS